MMSVTINSPLADLLFTKCGLKQEQAVRVAEVVDAELTALREQLAAVERELDIAATDLAARKSDLTARDEELRRLRDLLSRAMHRMPTAYVGSELYEFKREVDSALAAPPPPRPESVRCPTCGRLADDPAVEVAFYAGDQPCHESCPDDFHAPPRTQENQA